ARLADEREAFALRDRERDSGRGDDDALARPVLRPKALNAEQRRSRAAGSLQDSLLETKRRRPVGLEAADGTAVGSVLERRQARLAPEDPLRAPRGEGAAWRALADAHCDTWDAA